MFIKIFKLLAIFTCLFLFVFLAKIYQEDSFDKLIDQFSEINAIEVSLCGYPIEAVELEVILREESFRFKPAGSHPTESFEITIDGSTAVYFFEDSANQKKQDSLYWFFDKPVYTGPSIRFIRSDRLKQLISTHCELKGSE